MKGVIALLILYMIQSVQSIDCSNRNYTVKKIVWAVSLNDGPNTTRKEQAEAQNHALRIFDEVVMNKTGQICNEERQIIYELEWVKRNDSANVKTATNNTKLFCANEDVKVMFYTPQGDVATESLEYIDKNCLGKIGMGANGLSKNWYSDKSRIFSIPPITETRYVPILSFVKSLQKQQEKIKVALIYNFPHVFYGQVCPGLLDTNLQKNYNYEVVANLKIDFNFDTPLKNETFRKMVDDSIKLANNTGAQALLACIADYHGVYFLQHIQEKKYDFDLISVTATSPIYFQEDIEKKDYTDYVLWVDDYIPQIDKGKVDYFGNAAAFDSMYKKMFNTTKNAHPSVYRNLYAYITVMKAYETAESDDMEDLLLTISRTDYDTIVGRLTYDSYHRTSIKPSVTQTRFNGSSVETTVVGPPSFANAKAILPIPKYGERVYDPSLSTEEYAFLAITLAFIAISVIAGIAIIVSRRNTIIKAAAPLFMIGIIVGSIFVYIGSIFFRVHQLTTATCHLQVWFLALGFILMFGCLFSKSFRVWRLWNANLSKPTQVISDSQLGMIVGILTSVQLVLLIIYSVIGGVEKIVDHVYPYRPAYDIEHCTNNTTGLIILILLVIYGFLLMSFGIFLAWTTRKVPFLAFNESKIILFSMYNVAFFTLLALIVVLNSREMEAKTEFVLHSICILLSSFVTVTISVGNKFYLILHGKTTKSKTQTITLNNNTPLSDDKGIPMDEYEALSQENESLRAKISTLQSKVGEFEE